MQQEKLTAELLRRAETMIGAEVRAERLEQLRTARADAATLTGCEFLDMSRLRKDVARGLRTAARTDLARCSGFYIHVNPAWRWTVTIGTLSAELDLKNVNREMLYAEQRDVLECSSCPEASGLYLQSRNTPWENETLEFLLVCTLLEVQAAKGSVPEKLALYFGVAHQDWWVRLQ